MSVNTVTIAVLYSPKMVPWNGPKTKVQLKLTSQRCALLQEKKNAMAKKARREIASLVEKGKLETARVKTEGLYNEDIHIELLEIMELYAEMLIARFALLEMNSREPDDAIREPLCAIIHAAPRIELREMHALREMLMNRYGREFALAAMENTDNCVGDRIVSRLKVETPSKELVDMYIAEICKAYEVPFSSPYLSEDTVAQSLPSPKPHAAAEGPLPAPELSTEAAAATKSDKDIATALGTVKNSNEAQLSISEKEKAKQPETGKNAEEARFTDLEARFAALKRK